MVKKVDAEDQVIKVDLSDVPLVVYLKVRLSWATIVPEPFHGHRHTRVERHIWIAR